MRFHVLRVGAFAAILSLAGAACGGSGSNSDNGVASKSPDEIVRAAQNAIAGASAVHVAGSLLSAGAPVSLDLSLVSAKGGRGVMSENGLTFRIIAVGKNVYIQASRAVWAHFVGPAAAKLLDGRWLQAPATGQFASVAALTDLRRLYGTVLPSHGGLKKGAVTTVNGHKAVGVTSTASGETLYVATTGKPYPLAVVKSGSGGGRIVFDRINQPVSLAPPADALDLSKLR
jgi:hypothetical protein